MKIAFVYVTDARGLDLVRYSAISLALSQRNPCDIHIFCHRFEPSGSDHLHIALARLGASLSIEQIEDEELERHPTHGHVTKPTLLKLSAINTLTAKYDRIVYLDNDVLVFTDLRISALELGLLPIAAVADMDLSETGAVARSQRPLADVARLPEYFNAGFIVCKCSNWRIEEFTARYVTALHEHAANCLYKADCTSADQCAMNSTFEDQWLPLPADYNMQASAKFTSYWETAAVRHYCGPRKFIPVAPFRNDARDIAYLNRIRACLGLPRAGIPAMHEILYRMNFVRNYPGTRELRSFLKSNRPLTPALSVGEQVRADHL